MDRIKTRIAWTIAGSDSGGGAGIQTDLKVMNAFGVHGCSIITALTAQNSCGILLSEPVSETMLHAQLAALQSDLPPLAIKTGMLGSAKTCRILADFLKHQASSIKHQASSIKHQPPILICDPILKSTSGTALLETAALEILINELFPHIDVLTPNLPETAILTGSTDAAPEHAAEQLLKTGVKSVLIKGGHADSDECRDYWTDGSNAFWLSSPRLETTATHGTGCILSSAITAAIALGQSIPEAVVTAKTFLNQCLKSPALIGNGHGPMNITPFSNRPVDRPTIQQAG